MGVCCCPFLFPVPTHLPRGRFQRPMPAQPNCSARTPARACRCRRCGVALDLSLLEGHEETCRVNHLHATGAPQAAAAADPPPPLSPIALSPMLKFVLPDDNDPANDDDVENASEEELCVVCFQRRRCYVFLPCGHLACCGACTRRLDDCPICRASRTGLCYVPANVLAQYCCDTCGEFIAPTLFDGHRETCALALRRAKEEIKQQRQPQQPTSGGLAKLDGNSAENDVEAHTDPRLSNSSSLGSGEQTSNIELNLGDSTTPPTTHHVKHVSVRCVECAKEDCKLVICIPCGHRVMCGACAAKRSTCSVCLQEIRQMLTAFD